MPVNLLPVYAAILFWFLAVAAKFASMLDRYESQGEPKPVMKAAAVTFNWAIAYGLIGFVALFLFLILIEG